MHAKLFSSAWLSLPLGFLLFQYETIWCLWDCLSFVEAFLNSSCITVCSDVTDPAASATEHGSLLSMHVDWARTLRVIQPLS